MKLTNYTFCKPYYVYSLLLLFSFFITETLNAQTCNYCACNRTVTVNSIVYGNCLDSGEIGNEEYTVLVNGICFTENGGGTITGNYNTQVFNGCQDNLTLTGQAWEDDRGGRCDLNINGGAFDNDDDNAQNGNTNICILQPGTGTFTFGCVTVNYTIGCTLENPNVVSNLNGNNTACSTGGNTATVAFTANNDAALNGQALSFGVATAGTVTNPYGAAFATSGNTNAVGGNVNFNAVIPANTTCAPVTYDVFLYLSNAAIASICEDNTCQDFVTQTVTIWPDPSQFTVVVTASDNTCSYTLGVQECPAYTVTPTNFSFPPGTAASTQNVVINAPAGSACPNANTTVNIPLCALSCPDIAPNITTQDICSGNSPDFTIIETEVNATGSNQGAFTYFMDAAFTMPYGGSLTNQTCAIDVVTLFGRLQCTVAPVGSAEEFDDFQFTVNVYPTQPTAQLNNNAGNACSAEVGIVVIDLIGADGTTICDTKTFDASANNTCASVMETINYDWTVAEIETITGAPAALACYTAVMGSEMITVYPAQPTTTITNVTDACNGATDVVSYDVVSVGGAVCDTRSFDATPNLTCAVAVQNITDTYAMADLEALFGGGIGCYTDLTINENVNIYPNQVTAQLNNNVGDACSEEVGVVVIDLVAADGTTVCDTKTFDASANNTCASVMETINYDWTVAEVETITGAPAALACYTAITGNEMVTVYPAQPTTTITNIANACNGATGVVSYDVVSVGGAVCDTRNFDATPNLTCALTVQNVTDIYTIADLETLFTGGTGCYADLTINENVNIYPDANNFNVAETIGGCGVAALVTITAENNDVCFTDIGNVPTDPGCDNPDDVQGLTYNFNPNFIASCNVTFSGTVTASCATTFTSSDPAFTCPPAETDLCAGAGSFGLLPLDNNSVAGATGFFTGTGAGYIVGDTNPNGDASIDLTTVPLGIALTLTYNVLAPGCPTSSTTNTCTFTVVRNCAAEGGSFQND